MRNRKPLLSLVLALFLPFSLYSEEWIIPRTSPAFRADMEILKGLLIKEAVAP